MKKNPYFYEYLEGWLSIIVNFILFALKYWAGVVTGSVAIIADAWHTLSDSLTSIVVIVGAKFSSRPADQEHPFGHGRAELIGSIIIGILLSVVAFNFIVESVSKLKAHESSEYGMIAIIATVTSIVAKEVLAQVAIRFGKLTGSQSLIADGWHHRSDSISSVVILCGIFLGDYFWWIDGVLGIIVSLILFYAAFRIMMKTVSSLIGEDVDDDLKEKIIEYSKKIYSDDIMIHHIHIHRYGKHTEMSFHIRLSGDITLDEAHRVASDFEEILKSEMNIETTIHMEPLKAKDQLIL